VQEIQFFVFLAFVAWIVCRNIRTQISTLGNPEDLKKQLESDFRDVLVTSTDPRFSFDGRTAVVVKDDESVKTSNYAVVGMRVTRLARNGAGEYFLFLWDESRKPFFKHVDQSNAKLLLGPKYVSPTEQD